jgi:methyl-accepting chemotaxis protein
MQIVQVPLWLFITATIALLVCLLIQAGILLAIGLAAIKGLRFAESLGNNVTGKALPLLEQVRFILEDLAPKVRAVTADIVELSATARTQAKHVNSTVDDVVEKTREQAARVDEMVSAALNGVAHAASTIQEGVKVPARRVGTLFHDVRSKVEQVRSGVRSKVEEFRSAREPEHEQAQPAAATRTDYEFRKAVVADNLGEDDVHRPAV